MIQSVDRSGRVSGWSRRAACLTAVAIAAMAVPALAQPPAPAAPPFKGTPVSPARNPDGKPNWTGFWVPAGGMLENDFGPSGVTNRGNNPNQNVRRAPTGDSNLKSPYKERWEATRAALEKGDQPDTSALCVPYGMPRMMGALYGLEILQTPKS